MYIMAVTDHNQLVQERGSEYGESWKLTGLFIAEHADLIGRMGSKAFVYVMMHNKLMRALTSPDKADHYDDIIGYAKLALRALEAPVEAEATVGEPQQPHGWDPVINSWLTAREP